MMLNLKKEFSLIKKVLREKSLYPDKKRKSKYKRFYEIIKLRVFEGYAFAKNYNKYGFDIENFNNYKDYIDGTFLHTNGYNKKKGLRRYNHVTANKFLLYCYLSNINPKITPKVYNVLKNGKSTTFMNQNKTVEDIVQNMKNGEKLCFKLECGHAGIGFFLLEKRDDKVIINNGKYDLETFYSLVKKKTYLVQEFVYQHKDIDKFNPSTLNTIRLVTFLAKGKYRYLGAMFRCGTSNKECIDNASNGGIFVGINDDGTLKDTGYFLKAKSSKIHPTSKIKFEGYQLPMYKEVIDLALKYHAYFPGLKSLGWDIAITENGPIIIEINVGWQTSSIQMCHGGFRKKIEEIYGQKYKEIVKQEKKNLKS